MCSLFIAFSVPTYLCWGEKTLNYYLFTAIPKGTRDSKGEGKRAERNELFPSANLMYCILAKSSFSFQQCYLLVTHPTPLTYAIRSNDEKHFYLNIYRMKHTKCTCMKDYKYIKLLFVGYSHQYFRPKCKPSNWASCCIYTAVLVSIHYCIIKCTNQKQYNKLIEQIS